MGANHQMLMSYGAAVPQDNFLIRSNDFAKYTTELQWAGFMPHGVLITPAAAVSPTGATNASRLDIATISGNAHYFYQVVPRHAQTGQAYCLSFHVKAAPSSPWDYVGLNISDGVTTNHTATFRISTGAFVLNDAGVTTGVTALANGWYRIWISYTFASYFETPNFQVNPVSAAGSTTIVGNTGSGFLVYGAQLNLGTTPLTYWETVRKPYPAFTGITPIPTLTLPTGIADNTTVGITTFLGVNNRGSAFNLSVNTNPSPLVGSHPKFDLALSANPVTAVPAGGSLLTSMNARALNMSALAAGQYEILSIYPAGSARWLVTGIIQFMNQNRGLAFRVNLDMVPGATISASPSPFVWGHDLIP
jgi:hypothetical protein